MIARTHIIFGATLGIIGAKVSHCEGIESAVMVACAMFGSLLPDIDHPYSTFGKKIVPVSTAISAVFGHRGITHSLLIVLAMFFAMSRMKLPFWTVGILIGYLSHILGDWMTPSGVPLLWPNRTKFRSPFPFKTGSAAEKLVGVACVASVFLWLVK